MFVRAALAACLVAFLACPVRADEERDKIVSKLQNLKVSLDFRDTPLRDVVDFLREMAGFNIIVDAKIEEEIPAEKLAVTIKVDDLPLGQAMTLMLGMKDLTAVYRDGALVVVTKKSLQEEVYTHLYDVHDLLQQINDFAGPKIELKTGDAQGGEGVDPGTFITEEGATPPKPERLVEMIKDACGTDTWGGDRVSMQVSNGMLIVAQSRDVHRAIAAFLDRLRAAR